MHIQARNPKWGGGSKWSMYYDAEADADADAVAAAAAAADDLFLLLLLWWLWLRLWLWLCGAGCGCAGLHSRNAHGHFTRAIFLEIEGNMAEDTSGYIILCELAQWIWTYRKNHFVWELIGNAGQRCMRACACHKSHCVESYRELARRTAGLKCYREKPEAWLCSLEKKHSRPIFTSLHNHNRF